MAFQAQLGVRVTGLRLFAVAHGTLLRGRSCAAADKSAASSVEMAADFVFLVETGCAGTQVLPCVRRRLDSIDCVLAVTVAAERFPEP